MRQEIAEHRVFQGVELDVPLYIHPHLAPEPVRMAEDWGIDHGTWSVLVHAFPRADIAVVQLSIDARKSFEQHLDLGVKLAGLRKTGVLILGSGNVVHNLGAMDRSKPDLGFDWAYRFNDAAREILAEKPAEVVGLLEHPDYAKAAPTPEHFIPLLYLAGLASALINASFQVGAALGLAVLSAVATSRTLSLLAAHATPAVALSSGFHRALLVACIFLVAAAVIGLRAANTRGEPTGEVTEVAEGRGQAAVRRV